MTTFAAGRQHRRRAAVAVALLGLIDMAQAASHDPLASTHWLKFDVGGSTSRFFRYVLLLAGLALLSVVRGLLRGKRTAWLVALGAASASMVGHHLVKADTAGLVLAGGTSALLVFARRAFRARPDPSLARRAALGLLVGLVGAYVYGVVGLYVLDSQFRHRTTLAQAIRESTRLLFLLPVATIAPVTHHGTWFVTSVRVVVAVVLIIGIAGLLRPVAARARHWQDLDVMDRILEDSATTALAYFHHLPDKHIMFSDDHQAFIGYKLVGSVAVSLGGPIGSDAARLSVTSKFLERCELNGWLPAFHQATPDDAEVLAGVGLKSLKIGEEAIIDLTTFSLTGSHFKSIRSKTAKMEREGWTVTALEAPIDDETMSRLREVSDAWLVDSGHRERTFTLGLFDEEYLRETVVLVCRDSDGLIRGFTNLIPNYQSVNGTFDLMRRDPTVHLPVMDLLFVNMIANMRDRGLTGMNLGLAPFVNVDGDTIPDRALRLLYEYGGKAFNFAGLRDFKDKWRPRWEPRYLLYRRDTELPEIALRVAQAGELPAPDATRLELATGRAGAVTRALIGVGRRFPFSVAVAVVMIALQLVTVIDRDSWATVESTLHYNWSDLTHGQVYRIITAIFVQDSPGLRPGMLALIPLLAISEHFLRSWATAAIFFLGDLGSSLPILIALRVVAHSSTAAAHAVADRDGGTSSAIFAVLAAGVLAFRPHKARRLAVASFIAYLAVDALVQHRLFNVQHTAAVLIGTACWYHLQRRRTAGHSRLRRVPQPSATVARSI